MTLRLLSSHEMELLSSSRKLTPHTSPEKRVEKSSGDRQTSREQFDPRTATQLQVNDHGSVEDGDERKVWF